MKVKFQYVQGNNWKFYNKWGRNKIINHKILWVFIMKKLGSMYRETDPNCRRSKRIQYKIIWEKIFTNIGMFNQDLKFSVLAWRTDNIFNQLFGELIEA